MDNIVEGPFKTFNDAKTFAENEVSAGWRIGQTSAGYFVNVLEHTHMHFYTEHAIEYVHDPTPDGWTEIDAYQPHSTPWDDCHGGNQLRELAYVLTAAKIVHKSLVTRRTNACPQGTGPGGRIRFGDNMMPGIYRTAVQTKDVQAAQAALAVHNEAVRKWLHEGGAMPEAMRR